uniref:Citrate transport protein n=1 Tax=Glossina brevipalpis TaxID=37001 RepID=A0A1A9X472_9MUSC
METIKVKFINDQRSANPKFKGFFNGVSTIIQTEGVGGIYKGLTPTILKQGSNQAIRFFVMETMKDLYKRGDPEKKVPTLLVGVFGVVAGAASVFGNTPLDVVKTRMQGLEASKYKNTADCIVKIWKNEGPFAFYKGTVPRLGRVCLDVAITFMIYDSFMEVLLNSCQVHLPMRETSSRTGLNTTNTFRHMPSVVCGLGEGRCSMLRTPLGLCRGNSPPKSSIIKLRNVACKLCCGCTSTIFVLLSRFDN